MFVAVGGFYAARLMRKPACDAFPLGSCALEALGDCGKRPDDRLGVLLSVAWSFCQLNALAFVLAWSGG